MPIKDTVKILSTTYCGGIESSSSSSSCPELLHDTLLDTTHPAHVSIQDNASYHHKEYSSSSSLPNVEANGIMMRNAVPKTVNAMIKGSLLPNLDCSLSRSDHFPNKGDSIIWRIGDGSLHHCIISSYHHPKKKERKKTNPSSV